MNLPSNILDPLIATSVTRQYCLKYALKYTATKFTESSPHPPPARSTSLCILIAVAVGCASELWIPVIKHLYRLQRAPGSAVHISSVWVVDRPNHGDAAIMNRDTLYNHYSSSYPSAEYGAALKEFQESGLLSACELATLIAIGHSGGGAAFTLAVPPGAQPPYRLFILIDSPLVDRTEVIEALLRSVHERFRAAARKSARSWPSIESAMAYLKRFPPWNKFHAENLEIMAHTFFQPSADGDGVTPKTPIEQRVASFVDVDSVWTGSRRLVDMIHAPNAPHIYFMMATAQDVWPPPMAGDSVKKITELHAQGLGLTEIPGGHLAPHEKPESSAIAIMQILTYVLSKQAARL
ncbi:hypothetical protein PENSPDRAFT_748157 [Peniophora sp. CONT]|nr:hypothetical protein PENSPDRAFT_748157 [Peniophora sp. CONT]